MSSLPHMIHHAAWLPEPSRTIYPPFKNRNHKSHVGCGCGGSSLQGSVHFYSPLAPPGWVTQPPDYSPQTTSGAALASRLIGLPTLCFFKKKKKSPSKQTFVSFTKETQPKPQEPHTWSNTGECLMPSKPCRWQRSWQTFVSFLLKFCCFQTKLTLYSFMRSVFLLEALVNNSCWFCIHLIAENTSKQTDPISMNTLRSHQQTKDDPQE